MLIVGAINSQLQPDGEVAERRARRHTWCPMWGTWIPRLLGGAETVDVARGPRAGVLVERLVGRLAEIGYRDVETKEVTRRRDLFAAAVAQSGDEETSTTQ